jgi:hypothetical protein
MPFGVHRENYYEGLSWPSVVKAVGKSITSTTAAAIWTPTSGKKFRLLGGSLTVHVGVVTATNASAGDFVILYDHVVTAPLVNLGVMVDAAIVAGSILGTGVQSDTAFAAATTAQATAGALPPINFSIPGGYLSSAADNVLRAVCVGGDDGAAEDIGTGVIQITGVVWGHEE